ncbi:HAD-IB family hydrolase [Egibacter rhizosphaerae]|uniref:HAD-IB family hydrolase n=1 Tax=Egibacter rhizosphaerae TaxID=1670831 RepID=A0A411YDW8_9ACTN|nr:HAD-IB family hydrolase [Egibacter rhizosphaerae]QBI19391.1 HAD-IB family hydrolase [Egibacter rhizosphaerae]
MALGDGRRRAAAFFDLDKTVVAKSSALAYGRALHREGLISSTTVARTTYAQLSFQLFGADADKMDRSREAMLELMHGWNAARLRELVTEGLDEIIEPMLYPEALELLDEHRRAGHVLFLVSSAGEEIVQPLGSRLGVDRVIATRMGVDDEGRYDGTLDFYCYGPAKADAMRDVAAADQLDLEASYAYSDSITDLPMLEAVGHAVAVNPDRDLRHVAVERGWQVRDFERPESPPRLSHPHAEIVAGAGALSAVAALGWWLYHRRERSDPWSLASTWERLPFDRLAGARNTITRRTSGTLERVAEAGRRS